VKLARLLVVVAAVGAWPVPVALAQSVDEPLDAGAVVVVRTDDRRAALVEGASATEFGLRLPEGASCPGDSANDQWRVESFLAPAADDPGTFTYASNGPEGEDRSPLYEVSTRRFAAELLPQNAEPGQPAEIQDLPDFSFAVFPPGYLPAGRYRLGIACTYFGETAKYWDSELVITADADDQPGQLVWRAVVEDGAGELPADDGSSAGWVVAAGIAVVGLAAIAALRRRSITPTPVGEAR
jgi:MYXO-CTERM domain-containing protein